MAIELLTVDEVKNLIRVSRDTVYRLAAKGELPAKKIGRTWRFPKDELEHYLRQRGTSATPMHAADSSTDSDYRQST